MPIIKLCNFHFNSDYPMKQGKGLLTHDRNKADTLLLFFWNGQITHWINKMPKPIRTLPTLLWSHTLPRASGRNTELSQDQVLQKLNESNSGRNRGLRIWGFWKHELICCYSFITVQTWGRRDEIEMRGGSSLYYKGTIIQYAVFWKPNETTFNLFRFTTIIRLRQHFFCNARRSCQYN